MDFEYSSEQKLLWESTHKLMQRVATPDYLRRLDRERLYPYELYDAWVEAGLLALPFAEEYGGAGGSIVDLAIVSEISLRHGGSARFVEVESGSRIELRVHRAGPRYYASRT